MKVKKYEYKGQVMTIRELANLAGVSSNCMNQRLRKHEDVVKCVEGDFTVTHRRFKYKGEMLKVSEIARLEDCSTSQLNARLANGMTLEEALKIKRYKKSNNERMQKGTHVSKEFEQYLDELAKIRPSYMPYK